MYVATYMYTMWKHQQLPMLPLIASVTLRKQQKGCSVCSGPEARAGAAAAAVRAACTGCSAVIICCCWHSCPSQPIGVLELCCGDPVRSAATKAVAAEWKAACRSHECLPVAPAWFVWSPGWHCPQTSGRCSPIPTPHRKRAPDTGRQQLGCREMTCR